MKRYELNTSGLDEASDGDWVKFSDVEALVKAKDALIAMEAAGMIPQLGSFPYKTKTAQGEATKLARSALKALGE